MKRLLPVLLISSLAAPAAAYRAVTHAGLTERAAVASSLHSRLMAQLGRALGLYEPLRLDESGAAATRALQARLSQLDPEAGDVPDRGKLTALEWLVAGAAVENVPAWRQRHHFFDPTRGRGLDQADGQRLRTQLHAVQSGVGSLRGVFTGNAFDGSGMAATAWISAPENDWGLARYLRERERAATAPTAAAREGALARALLAAGSIVHLVEDMGDPTYVRNDYRVALESQGGPYERYVVVGYGRLGIPALGGSPVSKTHLSALFHDDDGSGLADRTHARFFSPGTLPGASDYALPTAAAGPSAQGYVSGAVEHLARYQRTGDGLRWSLDERCFADYAAALLPETGRYAAGALELLFRGRLAVAIEGGQAVVTDHEVALGRGRIALYADVGQGPRKRLKMRALMGAPEGVELLRVALPPGTRRVAAVFSGVDANGEPFVVVQEQSLP